MKREDRAKQFLPFDALKGFFELVQNEQNKEENRIYLSDESLIELDILMSSLKRGDLIEVKHYEENHYIFTTGLVGKIDYEKRTIQIVKKTIKVDDIVSVSVLLKNH